jgi:hypothetical protein
VESAAAAFQGAGVQRGRGASDVEPAVSGVGVGPTGPSSAQWLQPRERRRRLIKVCTLSLVWLQCKKKDAWNSAGVSAPSLYAPLTVHFNESKI